MGIISTLLTQSIISCQSNKIEKQKEIETQIIYPLLNFPKFPNPNNVALPLDADGQIVRDDGQNREIENVLIPFWFWRLIMFYVKDVKTAQIEYEAFVNKIEAPEVE